jgi:adenosylmethionine-8-amino-7-oxononanoate aminotransferase
MCGYIPAGAVIYTNQIWKTAFNNPSTEMMLSDVWQHDYTWSGHPVCSAVALKALNIAEKDNLIKLCAERGEEFRGILEAMTVSRSASRARPCQHMTTPRATSHAQLDQADRRFCISGSYCISRRLGILQPQIPPWVTE